MKRKPIVWSILTLFLISLLAGCVEEYKTETVEATVIDKEYDPPKTKTKTITENGQTKTKITREPAEYEVTIQYKDIIEEFEDEDLYDRVEEGDKIKVQYVQGLDEEGKVVVERLELLD